MKLIEFGSRHSFNEWFYRYDRSGNYPLTDLNYRHCWEDDTHIYRCVEKGKDVGIIFIKPRSRKPLPLTVFAGFLRGRN